jgi:hypothetical protein
MDEKQFAAALAQAKAELIEADKALLKDLPYLTPTDRAEILKTIFNRARDICKDKEQANGAITRLEEKVGGGKE